MLSVEIHKVETILISVMSVLILLIIDYSLIETFNGL